MHMHLHLFSIYNNVSFKSTPVYINIRKSTLKKIFDHTLIKCYSYFYYQLFFTKYFFY